MSMATGDLHLDATALNAVRVARALGDPARFRLLREIASRQEISCAELTSWIRLAQATVSHHLRVLADAGLITVRKSGPFHFYLAAPEAIAGHAAALSTAFDPPAASPRRPHRRPTSQRRSQPDPKHHAATFERSNR